DGQTSLHLACSHDFLSVAQLLLERGSNANAVDAHGWTPLGIACKAGHRELAILLLEWGAKASLVPQGTQAQRLATELAEVTDLVAWKRLCDASETGDTSCASSLLDRGADINQATEVRGLQQAIILLSYDWMP
ncbi:ankyrin repeat-containing domain protein, partial [Dunaliella salina]